MPTEPTPEQTAELQKRFEESQEFRHWEQFVKAVKDGGHATTQTVEVPAGFLRIAAIDLEATPFTWPVMNKVWNRIVAEMDLPDAMRRSYHGE